MGFQPFFHDEMDDTILPAATDFAERYCAFPELNESGNIITQEGANENDVPSVDEMRFVKAFLRTVRMNMSIRRV